MRPGDPVTVENAKQYVEEQLFDQRHYDLNGRRYKLNQKLDLTEYIPNNHRNVTKWDIVRLVRHLIMINNGMVEKDDIDHLGNRRVKTVGELISNKLRIGLRRMNGLSRSGCPSAIRKGYTSQFSQYSTVVAALREFFGSSQLSQFMDQRIR
jgi:DNA-directed RNA polymerase subunit beta